MSPNTQQLDNGDQWPTSDQFLDRIGLECTREHSPSTSQGEGGGDCGQKLYCSGQQRPSTCKIYEAVTSSRYHHDYFYLEEACSQICLNKLSRKAQNGKIQKEDLCITHVP